MQFSTPAKLTAAAATVGAICAAGIGLYARFIEPVRTIIEHVELPVRGLPDHLDGFTIAQLSDFHAGVTDMRVVDQAVRQINQLNVDLVLLTGDFVDGRASAIFDLAPRLGQLKARYGTYACVGNHDQHLPLPSYGTVIRYGLDYYGIRLLLNEHVVLENGLAIVGLDDPYRGLVDLDQAMGGISAETPTILMLHRPDYADYYAQTGRFILQLAGHTHGGQMNFPITGPLYLPRYGHNYINGLFNIRGMWLYVNRGLGVTRRLRMRLNCTPEITHLTLRRHQPSAISH